jgi:predicted outer membrane repeat protein
MKNNYFLRFVFTVLLCGYFSMSYGQNDVVYIASASASPAGSDGNSGTSASAPKLTLDGAMGALSILNDNGTIIVSGMVAAPTEIVLTKNVTIQGTSNLTDGFTGSAYAARFMSNAGFNLTLTKLKLTTFGTSTAIDGGALLLTGGTINITDVIFDDNRCTGKGGAIAFKPLTNLTVNVLNTTFKNNATLLDGGAFVYVDTISLANNITFTNCAMISNTASVATRVGGAGHITNGFGTLQLSFINSTIAKNVAGGTSSGGLFLANAFTGSNIVLTNCTITENNCGTAGSGGAGMRVASLVKTNGGKVKFYNCILENNYYPGASTTTAYTTDFAWQSEGFVAGTDLIIENSILGRPGSPTNTKWLVATNSFPTSKYNYVAVVSGDVKNSYLAKFGTFDTTTNSYPLGTGSFAIDYGVQSIATGVGAPFTAPTTDQIGTSRPQGAAYDAGAIEKMVVVATPPPTLTADATNNTVDNAIDIAYPSTPSWQAAITAVKVGGTDLTVTTDYVIADGNIQLKPAGLNALLTTAGTKTITVTATGYNDAIVAQVINAGVPTKLTMRRQPTAPVTNGGRLATQPQVNVADQYNNPIFVSDQITGLPTGGNWTIGGTNVKGLEAAGYVNFSSMTATNATAVTGATITFTLGALTPVVSAAFDIPAPIVWTGDTSADPTDATNWTAGVIPAVTDFINIPAGRPNYPVYAAGLTLNGGLIESGAKLTVTDAITNNGTLTIENNANLIQVNDAVNAGTGSAIVKRNSNPLKRLDYTLWSSPVTGTQTLAQFSPLTSQSPSRFYAYDPATNGYVTATFTAPFALGAGYLIRMPNEGSVNYNAGSETLVFPGQFTGKPNNGTVTLGSVTPLTSDKYYAVGNPYPSTIDASLFLAGNATDGTLYFWRKTNNVANTAGATATGTAYATWTTLGTAASEAAPNNILPNGTIAVGQGFIVKTGVAATTLTFTNAMRTASNNAPFFKTKQLAEKSRIWLNLTNTTGVFSQALIGYVDGATVGIDAGIDGKYINDSAIALTSNINGDEYTIQGRPAFEANDIVALNFKTDLAGEYSIAIDHVDGLFAAGQDIYLLDSKTGTETNLKESAYTFTASAGVDNARFTVKYQKTLKVAGSALTDNSVIVYNNKGTLHVNSTAKAISSIKVYDVQGRLLAEQKNVKAHTATISNLKSNNQILIVQVRGEDQSEVTKKVAN